MAQRISAQIIWNTGLWIGLGLVFWLLILGDKTGARSPYWFAEPTLYALMIAGLWANKRFALRRKIKLSRRWTAWAYIFLAWFLGMMFEAGLTVTGEGIGGVHADTLTSFILAQGDYIPIVLASLWVIRKYHLSFREAFFFAGGISLTEAVFFTGVLTDVIFSPLFFIAPLVVAYHTMAYAAFIALPLLIVNEELLWNDRQPVKHSIPFYWLLGFLVGMAIRIFWGLVYSPLVESLLDAVSRFLNGFSG